jgi:hypothetical protein
LSVISFGNRWILCMCAVHLIRHYRILLPSVLGDTFVNVLVLCLWLNHRRTLLSKLQNGFPNVNILVTATRFSCQCINANKNTRSADSSATAQEQALTKACTLQEVCIDEVRDLSICRWGTRAGLRCITWKRPYLLAVHADRRMIDFRMMFPNFLYKLQQRSWLTRVIVIPRRTLKLHYLTREPMSVLFITRSLCRMKLLQGSILWMCVFVICCRIGKWNVMHFGSKKSETCLLLEPCCFGMEVEIMYIRDRPVIRRGLFGSHDRCTYIRVYVAS